MWLDIYLMIKENGKCIVVGFFLIITNSTIYTYIHVSLLYKFVVICYCVYF